MIRALETLKVLGITLPSVNSGVGLSNLNEIVHKNVINECGEGVNDVTDSIANLNEDRVPANSAA